VIYVQVSYMNAQDIVVCKLASYPMNSDMFVCDMDKVVLLVEMR